LASARNGSTRHVVLVGVAQTRRVLVRGIAPASGSNSSSKRGTQSAGVPEETAKSRDDRTGVTRNPEHPDPRNHRTTTLTPNHRPRDPDLDIVVTGVVTAVFYFR